MLLHVLGRIWSRLVATSGWAEILELLFEITDMQIVVVWFMSKILQKTHGNEFYCWDKAKGIYPWNLDSHMSMQIVASERCGLYLRYFRKHMEMIWCLPRCHGQVEFVNYRWRASGNCILLVPLGKHAVYISGLLLRMCASFVVCQSSLS